MAIRNWKDIPLFKDVTEEQWNDWHWQVANRLDSVEKIKQVVNLTPQEELDKLRAPVETFFLKRDRGAGRPTKKDRRQMDSLWSNLSFDVPDDIAERFASDFGFDGDFDSDYYDDDDL